MSATFSINIGTIYESAKKDSILAVLKDIPDNTQKLISPRDIRDAFLFTWANIPFKYTSPKTLSGEYIGLDSGNPKNRDIKEKILLGKRSFGGSDVINSDLLKNDSDIFFFNTKADNVDNKSTKISILAGTNSQLYYQAPYIQTIHNIDQTFTFNFINPSVQGGPINILSETGRVSINGLAFPTVAENAVANNGQVLKYDGIYPNGKLVWSDLNLAITNVGTTNQPTTIVGSPVTLNGYPLEFIQDSLVPTEIGGINQGASFSEGSFNGQNWPLVEVIRELLYPYVEPNINLSIYNTSTHDIYAERGVITPVTLEYSIGISPRTPSEYVSDHFYLNTSLNLTDKTNYINSLFQKEIQGLPGTIYNRVETTTAYSNTVGKIDFIVTASDNGNVAISYLNSGFGFSHSATASIIFIRPFYCGFSSTIMNSGNISLNYTQLASLLRKYPSSGEYVTLTANGDSKYLYILYPIENTNPYNGILSSNPLKQVLDPNGYVLYDSSNVSQSTFDVLGTVNISGKGDYFMLKSKVICGYPNGLFKLMF